MKVKSRLKFSKGICILLSILTRIYLTHVANTYPYNGSEGTQYQQNRLSTLVPNIYFSHQTLVLRSYITWDWVSILTRDCPVICEVIDNLVHMNHHSKQKTWCLTGIAT